MEDLGRYRTGDAPMQVVSGPVHSLRVHFEAPPASGLDEQMERFVRWFNRTAPDGDAPLPAVTRAGAAHLYFESVHPYEDGNGRIGRAISEKALAQALGRPTLVALAATILLRRKAYYRALEAATRSNEITAWLRWFAGTAIEAQRRSRASVEFLIDKTRLLDRLRGQLNARQEKALLRVLREGPRWIRRRPEHGKLRHDHQGFKRDRQKGSGGAGIQRGPHQDRETPLHSLPSRDPYKDCSAGRGPRVRRCQVGRARLTRRATLFHGAREAPVQLPQNPLPADRQALERLTRPRWNLRRTEAPMDPQHGFAEHCHARGGTGIPCRSANPSSSMSSRTWNPTLEPDPSASIRNFTALP